MAAVAPYRDNDNDAADLADEQLPDAQTAQPVQDDTISEFDFQAEAEKILADRAADPTNFTVRGVAAGLVIGILICFSNVYFGLQTGWISGMSMPSSLISFGFFRAISKHLKTQFSPVENVLVQTVAGALGSMPLGCGMVGVMPALEILLKPKENGPLDVPLGNLVLFAVGICLFGTVVAIPLRKQTIIKEKLKFPSGSATALVIGVLHGEKESSTIVPDAPPKQQPRAAYDQDADQPPVERRVSQTAPSASEAEMLEQLRGRPGGNKLDWKYKIRLMLIAFGISAGYTIVSYFIPGITSLPIFGTYLANTWLWTLNPSPAYMGQGIIMGPATTIHMLIGAITGWAILSPIAKDQGWAPGPVESWETGSKGWIVWISLAIMLADAVVSLAWIAYGYAYSYLPGLWRSFRGWIDGRRAGYTQLNASASSTPRASFESDNPAQTKQYSDKDSVEIDAPPSHLVSVKTFWLVFGFSVILYYISLHFSFRDIMTFPASTLALIFALLLSVMGVRATGQTDLNPVSGISKLTQLIFATFPFAQPQNNPNAIALNLIAGAVSESAALQGGDLMQDLKTGHLLGASPKAQFYGQVIGSMCGAVISALVYRLYTQVYSIPSPQFPIPTAFVWLKTAELVSGEGLPPKAAVGSIIAGALYAVLTAVRIYGTERRASWTPFIPGGIAVAVGMYNTPSFTLARTIGGLFNGYWVQYRGNSESIVIVIASGLILGEGLVSIVNLIMEALHVPHL